jgi:ribosomal protein S18 acetylase RimI-like enzyme
MIDFIPMEEGEFEDYLARAVPGYAADNVAAGAWDSDGALEKARKAYDQFLPQGLATPDQHLFSLVDTDGQVKLGMIWYMLREGSGSRSAFICDFEIEKEHRRKGYGRLALRRLEEDLGNRGVSKIGLHVFGANVAARSLYESLGYTTTGVNMVKRLGAGS